MNETVTPARTGPNGRPVRPFVMPSDVSGRLHVYRYRIYRRFTQLGLLLLFFGTVNWDWKIQDELVLTGNFSSSTLLGFVPLGDPYASLQILLAGHVLEVTAVIGALIILAFWGLLSGRTWCAWACPINMVTDAANVLREKIGVKNMLHLRRGLRHIVLILSLVLSAAVGVAAFEWISPISLFHRELIFGVGLGWTAVAGIFLFDLLITKYGWCGHLCPLGAFYSVVGRVGQIRVAFDTPTCTHCAECIKVCPEPQILKLNQCGEEGLVSSGDCTNCGNCIVVCPEDTLKFQLRPFIAKPVPIQNHPGA